MVIEKKKSVWLKILSLVMVAVMCFSFAAPALAATSKKVTVNGGIKTVYITTGKGWQYSWGWKKTTVTVKNTGNKPVTLYSNVGAIGYAWDEDLRPGCTKTYTAKGSAKNYSLQVQGRGTVTVTVSAGSVR